MTVPFAHAGHWLASLAYAAPVIVLVGWMIVVKIRDRRSGGADAGAARPADPARVGSEPDHSAAD
jgi:hypothetical protein